MCSSPIWEKVWQLGIGALLARHIGCCDASVLQGHIVVLDAQMASEGRTIVARDIAGSVHARRGFQVFVHHYAVIDGEPSGSGQLSVRGDADTHRDEIGFEFIPSVRHHGSHATLFSYETRRSGVGEHRDALLAQERLDEAARFSVEYQT